MRNSALTFGMSYKSSVYKKGGFEDSAISIAQSHIQGISDTHNIKQSVEHVFTQNLMGKNHDIICKTTVSAPAKTFLGKVAQFFGLARKEIRKSTLYVSLFSMNANDLARYLVRDAREATAAFDKKKK